MKTHSNFYHLIKVPVFFIAFVIICMLNTNVSLCVEWSEIVFKKKIHLHVNNNNKKKKLDAESIQNLLIFLKRILIVIIF